MKIFTFLLICCSTFLYAKDYDEQSYLDLSLSDLLNIKVKTAGKFSQKATDVSNIIQVISKDEIANFGGNNLGEILDRTTSANFLGTFFFPQNSISLRGGISTGADHHVLLLLNGRPLRDSFTGGESFPFLTAFPLQLIEQIEIIRGPGSVLYGSNAFNGVINIVTNQAKTNKTSVDVSLGSFNTKKIQLSKQINQGDLKISSGLHYLKEDGWSFSAIDNNNILGEFDAAENNLGITFTGEYKQLTFDALYIDSKQAFWGPTSTWQLTNNEATSNLNIQSKRFMLDLGYKFKFSPERYLDSNVSFSTQDFSHINYNSSSKNTFVELTHHWDVSTNIHWLIGGSLWYQQVNSAPQAKVAPVPAFNQTWSALYSQINYQFTPKFRMELGAQINKIPKVNANTVPRLGLIYQFSSQSGFKANIGQAFRAGYGVETHFDLVICCRADGSNKGGLRGNPNLKPETITTVDAQYYYYTPKSQFNITYFQSKQTDLIERERAADRVLDFINRGKLTVKGIELEYKCFINSSTNLISSYSYQINENNSNVKNITLAPNNQFKIGINHKFENNINIALFNSYFSKAFDNKLRHPNRQLVNPNADSYNLLTANIKIPTSLLGFKHSDATFEVYVYNLLDEDIYQPEVAGGQINTNPLRANRSIYASFNMHF